MLILATLILADLLGNIWWGLFMLLLGVLGLAVLLVLAWWFLIRPRKQRRPIDRNRLG